MEATSFAHGFQFEIRLDVTRPRVLRAPCLRASDRASENAIAGDALGAWVLVPGLHSHRAMSRFPMLRRSLLGLALAYLFASPLAHAVPGEPLDLLDARPREIEVYFEISPREAPQQTRTVFSPPHRAWVEPGLRPSQLRVVIPAATVEAHLLGDQRPIPDSFSDFVWTFDTETGHVLSAEVRGRVRPELDWGFVKTSTQAEIHVDMGTAITGGFERPRRVLGNLVYRYCTDALDPGCRVVDTTPYDPATGYVNAVGRVWVHSTIVDVWNFSPMGEAIFKERPDEAGLEPGFAARNTGSLAAGTVELRAPAALDAVPEVSTPPPGPRPGAAAPPAKAPHPALQ